MTMVQRKSFVLIAKIIILCFALTSVSMSTFPVAAKSLTDLYNEKQQLAAKAEQARKDAAAKQTQADQVKQQINNLSSQINQTQNALNSTTGQINQTQNTIGDLEQKITAQEDDLANEKAKMGKVLSSWYMDGESQLIDSVLGSNTLSDLADSQQYYDAINRQIMATQDKIAAAKDELSKQKSDQDNQLQALNGLRSDQQNQQKSLKNTKSVKDRYLSDTNSAIADLKSQEAAAQARIQEINNQINTLTITKSWGDQIISSGDGLSVPYYTQTGNYTHLGNSPYTVSQYGCLVTSMAMVASFYGHSVSPSDIASDPGLFDRNGYLQYNPPNIGIKILPSQGVNWGVVDDELANGHPVIVSIYLPSVGAVNADGSSHFIVIKGKSGSKYLMSDPIGAGRGYNISQVRSMKIVLPS